MRPSVSIIIPCFNQAHLLQRALTSCLNQTYPNFEVLVIDDGNDQALSKSDYQCDERFIFFRQENKGLSGARNAGLKLSKGKFIKFLDADDWLEPDCLSLQINALHESKYKVAMVAYKFEDELGNSEKIIPQFRTFLEGLLIVNVGPIHAFLYPSEAFESICFCEENYVQGGHEDYDVHLKMALQGYEVITIPVVAVTYFFSPDSMSKNMVKMRETRKAVYHHFLKSALNKNDVSLDYLTIFSLAYLMSLKKGWLEDFGGDLLEVVSKIDIKKLANISFDKATELIQILNYCIEHDSSKGLGVVLDNLVTELKTTRLNKRRFSTTQREITPKNVITEGEIPTSAVIKVLNLLNNKKSEGVILLWGEGEICQQWLELFRLSNVLTSNIVVTASDRARFERKDGISFIPLEEIEQKDLVGILICSKAFYVEIEQSISNINMQDMIINVAYH